MKNNNFRRAAGLLALAALGLGSTASHATGCPGIYPCYYVNATYGNDANIGTSPSAPWKSLVNVNARVFNPGETVLFAQGQKWRERLQPISSGFAALPITYSSYAAGTGTSQPILSGGNVVTAWTRYSSSGLLGLFGQTSYIYYASQPSIPTPDYRSLLSEAGLALQDGAPLRFVAWAGSISATKAYMTAGSYSVDYNNAIVYVWTTDSRPPSAHGMEVANRFNSLTVTGQSYLTFDGLTFEQASLICVSAQNTSFVRVINSTIRNCGGTLIGGGQLAGNGIQWTGNGTNNSLEDSLVTGIFDSPVSPQMLSSNQTLSNTLISGNTLTNSGFAGVEISVQGPSAGNGVTTTNTHIAGVTITGNTITNIGKSWSGMRGGTGIYSYNLNGSTTTTLTGVVIANNNVQFNAADGIRLGAYSGITTIERNLISGNAVNGVELTDTLSATSTGINLDDNLIYDNGAYGLFLNGQAEQAFQVDNNVFYNNGNDSTSTFNIAINVVSHVSTSTMFNNICYGVNSICFYDANSIFHGSNFNNNIFYRASGPLACEGRTNKSYTLTQLSQFVADSQSQTAGYFTDPQFANIASRNFQLLSGSAGWNHGRNVGLATDFIGTPFTAKARHRGLRALIVLASCYRSVRRRFCLLVLRIRLIGKGPFAVSVFR